MSDSIKSKGFFYSLPLAFFFGAEQIPAADWFFFFLFPPRDHMNEGRSPPPFSAARRSFPRLTTSLPPFPPDAELLAIFFFLGKFVFFFFFTRGMDSLFSLAQDLVELFFLSLGQEAETLSPPPLSHDRGHFFSSFRQRSRKIFSPPSAGRG